MIALPQPSSHNQLKSLNSFSVSLLGPLCGTAGQAADRVDSSPLLPSKLGTASLRGLRECWWARRLAPSIGEWVSAELEVEGDRNGAFAAFLQPRRPVPLIVRTPRPFHPALGSSMRLSTLL